MSAARVTPCFAFGRAIPSRLAAVDRVCREIRSLLTKNDAAEHGFGLELVARECLNNAVLHGNRRNPAKKVEVHLLGGRKWLCLMVRDQGPGFKWRRQLRAPLADLGEDRGRGLSILKLYADRTRYNLRGNQITLWLRRNRKPSAKL